MSCLTCEIVSKHQHSFPKGGGRAEGRGKRVVLHRKVVGLVGFHGQSKCSYCSTACRTDRRFQLDDLDISGKTCVLLAHVTGWERRDLHDLATVFQGLDLCSVYTDPAQHIITTERGSI